MAYQLTLSFEIENAAVLYSTQNKQAMISLQEMAENFIFGLSENMKLNRQLGSR